MGKRKPASEQEDSVFEIKSAVEAGQAAPEMISNHENEHGGNLGHVSVAAGPSAFERERMDNIKKNKEYLRSIGLGDTKGTIGLLPEMVRAKQVKRSGPPAALKPKREPRQATRRSTRGQGKDAPVYNEERVMQELQTMAREEEEMRMDEGPLTLETISKTEDGGEQFLDLLKSLMREKEEGEEKGTADAPEARPQKADMDYVTRLAKLHLREEDTIKITPVRITSSTFHPSDRTLVIAAGDNDGNIGVWQVDKGSVFRFRPHITKIASMQYHPTDTTQLISASHDGTIRNLNFEKEVFDLVTTSGDTTFPDSGFTCAHMAQHSPSSLFLSGHNSSTALLDFRSKKFSWVVEDAHDKKVNSIEAHPTQSNLFTTASTDRSVKLWDLRNPKKSLWAIPHTNSVNVATFNPTGTYMIAVGQDHHIWIHENPTQAKQPSTGTAKYKIKHNNNTGRWLSKFWPTWDPKHPDAFVIGSLEQPRRVEVFAASLGYQIASVRSEWMNSCQSINCFHPVHNILSGCNSSGRVHIFRGP